MKKTYVLIALVIVLGLCLRLYGYNWDDGHHLHPDERFLTMVTADIDISHSFANYLDPEKSTMSPYNTKYTFYVYGTLPVTINKLVSHLVDMDSYSGALTTGRVLSALMDVGILICVIAIARYFRNKYSLSEYVPPVAGFIYAITTFSIQQAHFFTVDSFTTFFSIWSLYFVFMPGSESKVARSKRILYIVLAGVLAGCALGSKASAIYIVPLILFILGWNVADLSKNMRKNIRGILSSAPYMLLFCGVCYVSLRIADPRLFASASWFDLTINPLFINGIHELKGSIGPESLFPPNIQWMSKTPILFPLINIIFFGLGLPLALLVGWGLVSALRLRKMEVYFTLIWMLGFFLYQGGQYASSMRYFYILYPLFALVAGIGVVSLQKLISEWKIHIYIQTTAWFIVIASILVWPASFMAIYTRPHSRVAASEWMIQNFPARSNIASEHWDDPLPLVLDSNYFEKEYKGQQLPVFAPDNDDKWAQMNAILTHADFYVISSNRAYGSILEVPEKFPRTAAFYEDILEGKVSSPFWEYEVVAEFTSFPTVPVVGIELDDQWAEEAFSVYDHPKVTVLKRVR